MGGMWVKNRTGGANMGGMGVKIGRGGGGKHGRDGGKKKTGGGGGKHLIFSSNQPILS